MVARGLRMNVRPRGDGVNGPHHVSHRVLLVGARLLDEVWSRGGGRGGRRGDHGGRSLMVDWRVLGRQEVPRSNMVSWDGLLARSARKCLIWSRRKHGLLGKPTFKLIITLKVCRGLLVLIIR